MWCCIGENNEKLGTTPDQNGRLTKYWDYLDPKLLSRSESGPDAILWPKAGKRIEGGGKIDLDR